MDQPVDLLDYEALARQRMTPMAWEYVSGGAGDEHTVRWNCEAYSRIRLRPRCLIDVSVVDTRVSLLGRDLAHPILLAPTAYQRLVHPEGEIATARGAADAGALLVVSSFSTTAVEEIAAASPGPFWFQLYVQPDRGFTAALVRRAEAAGCAALVLTVDSPVIGTRYRELRSGFALPEGLDRPHLRGLPTAVGTHRPNADSIYSASADPSLSWDDIGWLRGQTRLPLVLKGVVDPQDAERAVGAGASAIIVSNHGGRNLDTAPATIDALPGVIERVAGRIPVLVDGGVRRGTDVLKAIATGATAVLIGRPYVYGLAAEGAVGVAQVVKLLRRELEMAMALTGRPTLGSVDSSVLWR